MSDTLDKLFAHKRFNLIAFCIIAAMILIAYSNTFTASFHFDDNPSIQENTSIRHATWENIQGILVGIRPVVYLSIMLNYQLGGLNVIGYHVFNIAIHILTSCFVYLLILWTLELKQFPEYAGRARWMAFFAALLYAVHPIQTESVTYIITRTELLATCFFLATFLLFIQFVKSGSFLCVIGLFITSALSMGSKEWAVVLPVLLAVYDFLFFAEGRIKPVLSRWYVYVLTAVPSLIIFKTLNLFAPGGPGGVGFNLVSQTGITAKTYFYTSMNVIWTYVRLLLLPINQNLDYDYPIAKTLLEIPTFLSLVGHIVVIGGAVLLYRKKGWTLVPFGLFWFYLGLAPTQGIVPVVDVIFEHRVYMPSVGFFLVFVVLYEKLFDWTARKGTA